MPETNRFDEVAATWDDARRAAVARGVADAIARRLGLPQGLDVLDFGCGTGLLTLALQPLVRKVTGVDASVGMLDVMRRKVREAGVANVEIAQLDPRLPLRLDARFHLIVSSMVLHHVADLAPLFARFREQLLPGGRVALADLDREDGSFHEDGRDVFHHGFERGQMQAWLAAAGFVTLEAEKATVVHKEQGDYPVFLISGRRAD